MCLLMIFEFEVGWFFKCMVRMFLQETFVIRDAISYDIGTQSQHNDTMWSLARGTLVRGTDSTELSLTSGQSNTMAYFDLTEKNSFCIELDCMFDCRGTSSADEIHFRKSNWTIQQGSVKCTNYPIDTWTHIKIEKTNGQLKIWVGDTAQTPTSETSCDMFCIQIASDDNYFKFKNFAYYPV